MAGNKERAWIELETGSSAGIPAQVEEELNLHLYEGNLACTVEQVPTRLKRSHEIWHEVDNLYYKCTPLVTVISVSLQEGLWVVAEQEQIRRDHETWSLSALTTPEQTVAGVGYGPYTVTHACISTMGTYTWFGSGDANFTWREGKKVLSMEARGTTDPNEAYCL
jgi:hypothetical protein